MVEVSFAEQMIKKYPTRIPMTNAERQAKWRTNHLELARERSRNYKQYGPKGIERRKAVIEKEREQIREEYFEGSD